MNKKYILFGIITITIIVCILSIMSILNEPITRPYCRSAPPDLHYNLAVDHLKNNYPVYSVLKGSATGTGPCNNGNIAWTKFDVLKDNVTVGEIIVNGDTNEVTFSNK